MQTANGAEIQENLKMRMVASGRVWKNAINQCLAKAAATPDVTYSAKMDSANVQRAAR